MAKKEQRSPSFDDFNEENLLEGDTEKEVETEEVEEVEAKEEEEVEEQETPVKEKKKKASTKAKKVEKVEVEEETEEEVEVEDKTKATETTEETETETKEEEEEPADADTFFAEVEKITGQEVEVEYGDTDPLSPQGVALREAAVRESTLDNFLEELSDKFPAVYRALQHANNGGDPAELFTQSTSRDYSKVTLAEGDDALAKEILKEYYKSKGVKSEAKIAKMLEADEDSEGGLVKEAQSALDELKAEQAEATDKVVKNQAQKAQEQKKRDQIMVTAIDEVLDTRQLGSFKITDRTEAASFRDYVLKHVKAVGDKYELMTPLDPSNIAKSLQYQYFQFKNGDLSKIIQQKATTEVAKKLQLRLKGEQEAFKKNKKVEDKQEQARTLKSYEVD